MADEKVEPFTGQDIFDLIIDNPDHRNEDRQPGDFCTYLDDHFNFSAIARALNERIKQTK